MHRLYEALGRETGSRVPARSSRVPSASQVEPWPLPHKIRHECTSPREHSRHRSCPLGALPKPRGAAEAPAGYGSGGRPGTRGLHQLPSCAYRQKFHIKLPLII